MASSSKTLIRSSFSLLNRLTTPQILHRSSTPITNVTFTPPPPSSDIIVHSPFPHLDNLKINNLHSNDTVTKLCSEGLLYPTGLPSIPFLLPDGDESSSSEPILLLPKRTYQPSIIRRKRNHGFFARKATVGGRRVIKRRIAKGRYRITA